MKFYVQVKITILRKIQSGSSKKKNNTIRKGKRRSHHSQYAVNSVECPNCGEFKLAHHVCNACGYYNKKEIVDKTESREDSDLDTEK